MLRGSVRRAAGILLAGLALVAPVLPATAAERTAWVDQCVADLGKERLGPAAARRYCACMYEIVGDVEERFSTELERLYPPAHRMCRREAGRR